MIFLPPHHSDYHIQSVADNCPGAIQYASCRRVSGGFGEIISQSYTGSDYSIYQHHFMITQPCILYMTPDAPVIATHYMIKGSPAMTLPGRSDLILKEGMYQLFYIPRLRQQLFFDKGAYHCMQIILDPAYLKKLADRHESLRRLIDYMTQRSDVLLPHDCGSIDHRITVLLDDITSAKEDEGETEIYRKSRILELFLLYIRRHHHLNPRLPRYAESKIESVVEYINTHLDVPLNVGELARAFGMSTRTLYRQFEAKTDFALYQYYNDKRLERAAQWIEESTCSISEISYKLAFSSVSSFSRAFTNKYGISPRVFQKRCQASWSDKN